MKNFKFGPIKIVLLIILLVSIPIDMFFNFIISLLDIILFTKHFENPYAFTKFITTNTTFICNIVWLNKILLLIAGILPSLLLHFALNDLDMPNWLKNIICILLYYIILQLFAFLITWIIFGIAVIIFITFKIIFYYKNKKDKAKNEKEIQ